MRIGLMHYSGPPIVGGVEQTLHHHSLGLADAGHHPRLIVGIGEAVDPRVEIRQIPQLYSKHPDVLAVKAELDQGQVSAGYRSLRDLLAVEVRNAVDDLDALVVHNALTLHKNLALTAALFDLHSSEALPRLIGWHHDFAWDRGGYRGELHPGEPWELLRTPWRGVVQVVVSSSQRQRLAQLHGVDRESIHVVPPGIDPSVSGRWTPLVRQLAKELDLLEADLILLIPARITRRKNIEYGIQLHAALRRRTNQDVRLLVTGPPGPHNPQNLAYVRELRVLCQDLGISDSVHMLFDIAEAGLDDDSMAALYMLSDALLFPSRDEGFGIPILEAAYARMPIFCSDIPAFRESAGEEASFFTLDEPPDQVAARIEEALASDGSYRLRRRVQGAYTWSKIVNHYLLPLLEGRGDG